MTGAGTCYQHAPVPHHTHAPKEGARMAVSDSSPKLCECGCGQPTPLLKRTRPYLGHVQGQPMRFVPTHGSRMPRKAPAKTTPAAVRFWMKVNRGGPSECWLWHGCKTPHGYGVFQYGDAVRGYAHRWAYQEAKGSIPAGLSLDHLCRNPSCVNPGHLEAVTHRENMRRGAESRARERVAMREVG